MRISRRSCSARRVSRLGFAQLCQYPQRHLFFAVADFATEADAGGTAATVRRALPGLRVDDCPSIPILSSISFPERVTSGKPTGAFCLEAPKRL
jgi:hypothetical protein